MDGRTHVAVAAKVLEQLYLAQRTLGENLFGENIGDFFNGNALGGLVIDSGTGRKRNATVSCRVATYDVARGMRG